jgi:hypothetical protein
MIQPQPLSDDEVFDPIIASEHLMSLPRSLIDVQKSLQIVFVNFRTIRAAMLGGIANAYIDRFKCFRLLYMLKKLNEDYVLIPIPAIAEDMPDYSILQQLPPGLIDPLQDENALVPVNVSSGNMSIITDARIVSINRQASGPGGIDIASVRQDENDDIESSDEFNQIQEIASMEIASMEFHNLNQLQGIDGTEDTGHRMPVIDFEVEDDEENPTITTYPVSTHQEQPSYIQRNSVPTVNTVYGNLPMNAIPTSESLLIGPHGDNIGNQTRTQIMARELQGINNILGRNQPIGNEENILESIENEHPIQRNAIISNFLPIESEEGDSVPMNEYTENDKIMRHSFPLLFLLGKGVPQVGSININWLHHLLRQYSNKFAIDKNFVFFQFNQMQRHETARAVTKKIKNNPFSMEKAAELLASSEFQERLLESIADPGGNVAKQTLQAVNSIMVGMGKSVSFTAAERADVITTMYALMQRYGLSSSFLTMSPDDTNDIIMLRICNASTSNSTFPANSEIEFLSGKKTFKDVLDENFTENPMEIKLKFPITPVYIFIFIYLYKYMYLCVY